MKRSWVHRAEEFEREKDAYLHAPHTAVSKAPLVSIIVTSFNSGVWLERALRSALGQSWSRLEVILVDDASQDDSLIAARRISQQDGRLRVFQLESNVGTYCAKNAGMDAARGEVITFMDSDDVSQPSRIEKQLALLRSPGLVATTCNYERRTLDGTLVMNLGLGARQALISLMIKRRVFDEIGWFDSVRMSADDEYFERVRHTYGRLGHANVNETLYHALQRSDSVSARGPAAIRLDSTTGNDPLSAPRRAYVDSYRRWYSILDADGRRPYLPRSFENRPFAAPLQMTHTNACRHQLTPRN